MGFVPFPQVCKFEIIMSLDGQAIENVFYYDLGLSPDVTTMTQLSDAFRYLWTTGPLTMQGNACATTMFRVTSMEEENSPGIEYTANLPIYGADVLNAALPNNVTVAVHWSTGLRGRSYSGRTYHAGITKAFVEGSHLAPGAAASLIAKYTPLINIDCVFFTAHKVVASRIHNGVERTTGVATPILAVTVDSALDSQRRRLPGRGE